MSLVINHSSSVQSSSHAAPNDHHQPESGKSLSEKESTHLAGGAEKADKPVLVAINELSKYNKIKYQFVLLDEIGPAHSKTFYVALKLGLGLKNEESYTGSGLSIKKAQHNAADIALKETKFKKPPEKTNDQFKFLKKGVNNPAYAPTVKLNALAMKLGLLAVYSHTTAKVPAAEPANKTDKPDAESPVSESEAVTSEEDKSDEAKEAKKAAAAKAKAKTKEEPLKLIFLVKLSFAGKEFDGKGSTLQSAKHDAASKALDYFTDTDHFLEAQKIANSSQDSKLKAYRPPQFYKQQAESEKKKEESPRKDSDSGPEQSKTSSQNQLNIDANLKSDIMLVYEYAHRLNKIVKFELVQESGPSHFKKFVTRCFIQNNNSSNANSDITRTTSPSENTLEAVGEGHSKKLSKHDSAAKMLVILNEKFSTLLSLSNTHDSNLSEHKSNKNRSKRDSNAQLDKTDLAKKKKRSRNIEKIKKISPDYGKGSINPISRLIQIQQAKKENEPVFQLISPANENNITYTNGRKPEFVMQVSINPTKETDPKIQVEGRGSTKKIAKQNAAEAALKLLGYQPTSPALLRPSIKSAEAPGPSTVKITPTSTLIAQNDNDKKVKFTVEENGKLPVNRVPPFGKKEPNVTASGTVNTNVNPPNTTNKLKIRTQANIHSQDLRKKIQDLHHQQQFKSHTEDKISSHVQIDPKQLELICKLAFDLLEGLKEKPAVNQKDYSNFYTRVAEEVLKKNSMDLALLHKEDFDEQGFEELALINGGSHVNYKRVLEFLARIMNFKVNYQSLMGRDKNVYSYISINILPTTEKPLNGQGLTHIESANSAAQCAIKYLASKYSGAPEQPKAGPPAPTDSGPRIVKL